MAETIFNGKTCSKCGMTKTIDEFYANSGIRCKDCRLKAATKYRQENHEAIKASRKSKDWYYDLSKSRESNLKWKFGMSVDDYDRLLAQQKGVCAICGTDDPGTNKDVFAIDHDHSCCPGLKTCGNCVRGLLCHKCNWGLGAFGDDPDRALAAATYLLQRKDVLV